MKATRCIKCGRLLRNPVSIARGMGPGCAGDTSRHHKKYHLGVCSQRGSSYAAAGNSTATTPTVSTLTEEIELQAEPAMVNELDHHKSRPGEVLMKYPTGLAALVLSAPDPGAIAWHIKKHSGKKKSIGAMPPGRVLQEIRRMCIDLRLTFFPGMSTPNGQQIACIPYGEEEWMFENSEKVMSRQELEAYLSRYGMIRLTSR